MPGNGESFKMRKIFHLAVLTDFVPLKWDDLARRVAWQCRNKIRASVKAD